MYTKLYFISRQIHRLLVLVISVLTVLMATTGAIMKYSAVFSKYMSFIDLGMVRYIHNNLSPFFTAALGLMALSGLYMYFYTLPARKKSASTPPSSNLS